MMIVMELCIFEQIVMDVNVNVLYDKLNNLKVLFMICCGILSIINGYQIKLKKFASIIDYDSYNQVCI